jgi:steroid 5-alpha reductase family enzyme
MTGGAVLFATLAFALGAMLALWLVSLVRRDASIVDVWWGPGFAALAALAFVLAPQPGPRAALLLAMTTVWALRLGGYLLWRNWGRGEDPRYARMRRHHGGRFPLVSLVTVFALQGALQWSISLPVQVTSSWPGNAPLGPLDALGVVLFAIGLFFETVGDFQLARFRADPAQRGRVLDTGLWRYTRHPNYFGDSLAWWGLWVVAASTPYGPITVFAPILMTFLLMRVSGVPMLERGLAKTRPGYREYVERTPSFFPWFPKERAPGSTRGAEDSR